jgi:hypothetical protein
MRAICKGSKGMSRDDCKVALRFCAASFPVFVKENNMLKGSADCVFIGK